MSVQSPNIFADASATTADEPVRAAAIEVSHLTHRYPRTADGQAPALDDVSFRVEAGEIFGVLGPNGSGKTTLFRILATLLPAPGADQGSVHVAGHDPAHQPAGVRSVLGVVFQHPSLDAKLTARENLVHQGRLHGLRGGELNRRIDTWLERFQLADRADEYTERLSGGMRRRVELAKAMLHEPRLLLMDEPATGLDPGARRNLWLHLEQLRRDHGITVAMTTHLMEDAERCDRLAILERGRLIALDTPTRLRKSVGGDVITVEPATDADTQAALGDTETRGNHHAAASAEFPQSPSGDAEDGSNDALSVAQMLARRIAERFGPWNDRSRPRVVDGKVRFEKPDGAALIPTLVSALPGQISRVTVGQPTLEDVFLDLTGEVFHDADA